MMSNEKELYFDPLDAILPSLLSECVKKEAESFLSQDTSNYVEDPRLWKRIRASIKKRSRPPLRVRFRTAALACLIIISLLLTACMCMPKVREAIWETFLEWREGGVIIGFKPAEPVEPPTTVEKPAVFSYLPAGYYSEPWINDPDCICTVFCDSKRDASFFFSQKTMFCEDATLDYEDGDILTEVDINGNRGMLIIYPDEPNTFNLCWTDGVYKYCFTGDFPSIEELLKVARGVVI